MIVAKQSVAAVNHSDEYAGYTALLTSNTTDLSEVIASAFGNTAASEFARDLTMQNGYLVDYTIGVVTHNQSNADTAMTSLGDLVVRMAKLISTLTDLPTDQITQLLKDRVSSTRTVIDDGFAQNSSAMYADLHSAYSQTSRLGDAIASRAAQKFPDKFPGDASGRAVDLRVTLSDLFQEHVYLATMTTEAVVAARSGEKTAAAAALSTNGHVLGALYGRRFGATAGTRFEQVWSKRDSALASYAATGDTTFMRTLTASFTDDFASVTGLAPAPILNQVTATLKVVDDQRGKAFKSVAADDRAAASGMEPIALGLAVSAQG